MFVTDINKAFEALHLHVDKLQEKADTVIQPIMELKPYPKFEDYTWSAFHNAGSFEHGIRLREEYFFRNGSSIYWSWDTFTKDRYEQGLTHFKNTYEQWKKDCEPVVQENQKVLAHNKLQAERIEALMETLGVRKYYSTFEYKTSRSRNKTEKRHTAGYVSDLTRITPTDEYPKLCKMVEDKYRAIERFGSDKLKEAEAKRAEVEEAENEKKRLNQLATLRAKYTPNDFDSDLYEVLGSILEKDKYMMLAYYLEKN